MAPARRSCSPVSSTVRWMDGCGDVDVDGGDDDGDDDDVDVDDVDDDDL